MDNKVLEIIERSKIVPVIKIDDAKTTIPLLKAVSEGGIKVAEITYRTAAAKEAIDIAVKNFPDMLIGAGSVINLSQAKEAYALGVKFIVSPGFSDEVAEFCISMGIPYFGGCVTPTEIMRSVNLGLNIIKFFPCENYGGLATMKALAGPFPQIKFMPTGGIGIHNIKEYLAYNKIVACGGSWMVKDELIKNGDYEKIKTLCKEAAEAVAK